MPISRHSNKAMRLTPTIKDRIDAFSYDDLLHQWNTASTGDPLFLGESGEYIHKRLLILKFEEGKSTDDDHTQF